MRRSVLLRFLALSLAVALGAVIATAVIATYSTSEKLQGEINESASQLEADGLIHAELLAYGTDHSDWSGVDRLVGSLSAKTGRRVALTTPDGDVIADSARALGAGPELPARPAATLDVLGKNGPLIGDNVVAKNPGIGYEVKSVTIGGNPLGSPGWRMTEAEKQERTALSEKAVACLRDHGLNVSVISRGGGSPQLVGEVQKGEASTKVDMFKMDDPAVRDCVPEGMTAASSLAQAVSQDEADRAKACLDKVGEPYTGGIGADKLAIVQPLPNADGEPVATPEFAKCTSEARAAAYKPYVAPPAQLYLGTSDNFNFFSGEGMLRTAATALGVLLIATLVMVLAGRRLVRPILALTGAAQQMATGHRGARVPVTGTDEVARLGHAFNAMAASIEQHDHQRKALVSDVAHELRTPLANIKGYLVASEDGVVPLDRSLVGNLLEEADLLERLVVDLQDLALADAGMLRLHPEPRDLSELVQQVVSAHRPQAESARVRLSADVTGPAPALVDGARIRQAVGNLVSNAIRFTPAGGNVVVSVRSSDGIVALAVADTGTGISAEHLPHLFDRFYRVEGSRSRATGGSGLGLAITKHLVEAHQGRIGVASTPNQGSTFTIRLPSNLG